jgi:hypothetical protein
LRVIIGRDARDVGDVVGEPHPRLRQRQPKHFIALVVGGAGHRYAFLGMSPMVSASMILNNLHHKNPRLTRHERDYVRQSTARPRSIDGIKQARATQKMAIDCAVCPSGKLNGSLKIRCTFK